MLYGGQAQRDTHRYCTYGFLTCDIEILYDTEQLPGLTPKPSRVYIMAQLGRRACFPSEKARSRRGNDESSRVWGSRINLPFVLDDQPTETGLDAYA